MRLALLTALVLAATPAMAAEPAPLKATYGLYAGGVRMIELAASFDIKSKTYEMDTDARTIGAFSKILPWTGQFKTTGEAGFKPTRHDYTVSWRGKVEQSTFLYEPAGTFKSMTLTKEGKTTENPVDTAIADGTRDLLSTIGLMLDQYGKTGKCGGDVLTFDNARSFIVRFIDIGEQNLNNPKLSSYTGPAHGCSVEIIPQKGKWPKKPRGWLRIQQDAKAGGRLPVLWLATPREGAMPLPVRVDIHTKYGDVFAHLKDVTQ